MRYVFRKKGYALLASILDGIGNVLVSSPGRHGVPLRKISPKKILIVRLDHLGDVLQAAALPQVLKENFSGAEIHFLTNAAGETLLRNNPYVNRVWIFSPGWYKRSGAKSPSEPKFSDLLRSLRAERFDLALAPRGDIRENFLLWRIRAKIRLGYGITGGGFFLTHRVPYAWNAHESRHALDLLHSLGIQPAPLKTKLYWTHEEEAGYRQSLKEKCFLEDKWVAIQVDAGTSAKKWPLQNLEKLLAALAAGAPHLKIVLLGDDTDGAKYLEKILSKLPGKNCLNLVGKTSLRELFYLMRSLRAYVGPDSGPAHVAASQAIPTLFLFSGTNSFDQWKSLAESAHFLRHAVPCSPCHRTQCPVEGHPCMSGIGAEDVGSWLRARC